MAKKRIIVEETYKKDALPAKKEVLTKFINQTDTQVYIEKTGQYEDGKEFMIIKIDNI